MFGSSLGRRKITTLMMEHPQAARRLSPRMRKLVATLGAPYVRLFGYPLSVGNRLRALAVMRMLAPVQGERVLDVGCGLGYYVFELATRYGCDAHGVDVDRDDITMAKEIAKIMPAPNAHFAVGDGRALRRGSGSWDAILLCEVLEHVKDDAALLREASRVLVPGGRLVLTTPRADAVVEYDRPQMTLQYPGLCGAETTVESARSASGHVRSGYNLQVLQERLSQAGLALEGHLYILKRFSRIGGRWGMLGFPLGYTLAMLDAFDAGPGGSIVALAVKSE